MTLIVFLRVFTRPQQEIKTPLEIVADAGEVDLGGFFGEVSLSQPSRYVGAFPNAEDLLDPATGAMDRPVPVPQTDEPPLLVEASMALSTTSDVQRLARTAPPKCGSR